MLDPYRNAKETLADRIALLEKIKNQPPNTSYHELAEISGVPKSTIACVIQQREKLRDDWISRHGQQGTSQKQKHEGNDSDVEEPSISGSLSSLDEI
jgi:hypothetical protein